MTKYKNITLNTLTALSIILFLWLFISWAEIGLRDPLEQPVYSNYNAWVMLTDSCK